MGDEWEKIEYLMACCRNLVKTMYTPKTELRHTVVCFNCLVANLKDIESICVESTKGETSRALRIGVRNVRKTLAELYQMHDRMRKLLSERDDPVYECA